MLLFKILAAPVLICFATLVSRRWGPAVGGWVAGLPLTSGPVSIIFALQFGPAFAGQAAAGTVLGVVAVAVFAAAYARLAAYVGPVSALIGALLAYCLAAAVLSRMHVPLAVAASGTFLAIALALLAAGNAPADAAPAPSPRWDLPFRATVAALMVLFLAELGERVGPQLAGVVSPFPVFACTMGVFAHLAGGAASARRLMRGVITGSFAFSTFFIVVALVVTRTTVAAAYVMAALAALTVNALSLKFLVLPAR